MRNKVLVQELVRVAPELVIELVTVYPYTQGRKVSPRKLTGWTMTSVPDVNRAEKFSLAASRGGFCGLSSRRIARDEVAVRMLRPGRVSRLSLIKGAEHLAMLGTH